MAGAPYGQQFEIYCGTYENEIQRSASIQVQCLTALATHLSSKLVPRRYAQKNWEKGMVVDVSKYFHWSLIDENENLSFVCFVLLKLFRTFIESRLSRNQNSFYFQVPISIYYLNIISTLFYAAGHQIEFWIFYYHFIWTELPWTAPSGPITKNKNKNYD